MTALSFPVLAGKSGRRGPVFPARTVVVGVMVVVGLALAGCGSGSEVLSKDGSAALSASVADLRTAAAVRDADRARADLVAIRTTVADLQRRGEISEKRATDVLASADAVEASLALITTTTAPPVPIGKDKHDEKKKHDKGDHGD
jgi:hypothetical protein